MDITPFWAGLLLVVSVAIILVPAIFFIVSQQNVAVVERLGRFSRIARPGLRALIPFFEHVKGRMSLRILQMDVPVETKTQDNVFVNLMTSVQYRILEDKIFEAFYTLESPDDQIQSFVFDAVRAQVPKMILDDVFSKKDDIANIVCDDLMPQMKGFGYEILKVLITDIQPDAQVKSAMNEINTAQRLRLAAQEKGEAEKVIRVKQAEAEAESNILHGKGLAGQRHAIIEGLKSSVEDMMHGVKGVTRQSVMEVVMMTQYLDMLKDLGSSSQNSVIFVPSTPQHVGDLGAQIRETIFASDLLAKTPQEALKKPKTPSS
ncbi:SPFH domain-containing protein [bacterium NHP-B]|nr:SPFH domain-containing protein [bacterium NHP-B]